ncbi:MAG: RNA 3'-terminal phosphate cyclase [Cyanobacteria bacterium SZAS-4]|nr:RNA 3'-terminal phosphate cyclase [Cyanobacteria bacterium SZAS-4]
MLTIDGSFGEGGGQILRTSLALSLVTGKPFKLINIRANRTNPGLQQQHLTAVKAAATISDATVEGDSKTSQSLVFEPGKVKPGTYEFDIGTAGSTTLVFQTILPPLMMCKEKSNLTFTGGTHNPHAPPFDYVNETYVRTLEQFGPVVKLELARLGFYPPGGGMFSAVVKPVEKLETVELLRRGKTLRRCARSLLVRLSQRIGQKELDYVRNNMPDWGGGELRLDVSDNAVSAGNALTIQFECEYVTETFTAVGTRGLPAEKVAENAVSYARRYTESTAAVGEFLADQILIPFALAGAGSFTADMISSHTETNIDTIKKFLDVDIKVLNEETHHRIDIKS